jgi:hypothetical protein
MIKEEKVIVDINTRNIRYYQELGYEIQLSSFGDKKKLEVKVEQVSKSSKIRITAICEICENEKSISVNKYYQNHARGGFYSCFKCKNKKKEMTNLKLYGVKSYSETQDFKNKFKKTCLEKYGVENPNMLKDFREKTKKTCLEKYGFTEFSLENLYINGLISRTDRVKVLANGELKAKLTFKVNAASDKAKAAVEASGGTLEIVK